MKFKGLAKMDPGCHTQVTGRMLNVEIIESLKNVSHSQD
jgi:hypothetical protein